MKTLTKLEKLQTGATGIIAAELLKCMPALGCKPERWEDIASRMYFAGIDAKVFDRAKVGSNGLGRGVVFLAVLAKLDADGLIKEHWDASTETSLWSRV